MSRAHRHRRAEAARFRHRHLHPEPAAAAGAPRPRRPSSSCSAGPTTSATLASLGENFRPVAETAGNYSIAEQFKIPLALRREGVTLFHAPHYVLPPLVPCRSVVTIHDCIHLMFPQYLPNRLALRYARTSIALAARRADARADGLGELEARHPAVRRHRRPTRSTSSTTPTTSASASSRAKRTSSASASAISCTTSSCCTPATSSRTRTSSG